MDATEHVNTREHEVELAATISKVYKQLYHAHSRASSIRPHQTLYRRERRDYLCGGVDCASMQQTGATELSASELNHGAGNAFQSVPPKIKFKRPSYGELEPLTVRSEPSSTCP